MSSNQSIRVYSQLFDESYVKDVAFYKILFTTPVHTDAFLSVLDAYSDSIIRYDSVMPLKIIRELFYNGLILLDDAILFPHEDCGVQLRGSNGVATVAVGSAGHSSVSIDGDDITDLQGTCGSNDDVSSISGSTTVDIGADITKLSIDSRSRRPSKAVSDVESVKPTRQFEAIDEELRQELVTNILVIFQILFNNIYECNKKFAKLRMSSKDANDPIPDLLIKIFDLHSDGIIAADFLSQLLTKLTWYLHFILDDIENSDNDEFPTVVVVKETIMLIVDILKPLMLSFIHFEVETSEFNVVRRLLHSFTEVNVHPAFQKLLDMTNGELPKVTLSADSMIIVYSVIVSLANLPTSLFQVNTKTADITNLNTSLNQYEKVLQCKPVDDLNRLIPLNIMELNYFYQYRPDLLDKQISKGSFFLWLTKNSFSDNLYSNFPIISLSKLCDANDPKEKIEYIQQLTQIMDRKVIRNQQNEELEAPELLTTNLMLLSYCKNPDFVNAFTKQMNEVQYRIEDIDPQEVNIELFELWICVSSYIFQYQYKSVYFQLISKVILHILLKLIKQNVTNIKQYQMNEFKWKLCHQKSPLIPTDHGKDGFKSGLFYILDVLQNMLRFNLTNRLKIETFQLATNCIYLILQELQHDETINLTKYNWSEFYNTIFSVLKFIKKQDLQNSKHFQKTSQVGIVTSVLEELVSIIDYVLSPRFNVVVQAEEGEEVGTNDKGSHLFKSINYDLVYNILLNYDLLPGIVQEFEMKTGNLVACLRHFEEEIYLTEESKTSETDKQKINLFDYDFDSPLLIQLINKYLLETGVSHEVSIKYKYDDTFKYVEQDLDIDDGDMIKMINVILSPKNKYMSRFLDERLDQ
jgi:hypothetical protein